MRKKLYTQPKKNRKPKKNRVTLDWPEGWYFDPTTATHPGRQRARRFGLQMEEEFLAKYKETPKQADKREILKQLRTLENEVDFFVKK